MAIRCNGNVTNDTKWGSVYKAVGPVMEIEVPAERVEGDISKQSLSSGKKMSVITNMTPQFRHCALGLELYRISERFALCKHDQPKIKLLWKKWQYVIDHLNNWKKRDYVPAYKKHLPVLYDYIKNMESHIV